MLNASRTRWIAAGSLAVLLAAAGVALAGDGAGAGAGEGRRHRRGERAGPRMGRAVQERRHRMVRARTLHAMERLDALSDEQAKVALDASKDLAKIRKEVRSRAAAVVLQGFREEKAAPDRKEAIREATRAKVKALREEFKAPFLDAGMKIVRSLTPEQKAKIEEAGKRRRKADAKPVTDEQLARFFGLRLSHPWAGALLKARVEGGATVPANK